MELEKTIEPIVTGLERALRGQALPLQYRDWGARLLDHLGRPVRVVVTGLPGSGKSALINMMLSRSALGGQGAVPVTDVVFGPVERVVFETEAGPSREAPGLLAEMRAPERAVRARQELPDPALRGQSFRELGLTDAPEISRRILSAALKDADIVLWCTNSFGEIEQSLWASVPDEIKDHSFLVVTRADRQMMWGVLSQTLDALEPIVAEEFLGLYPVATLQGLSALTAGTEPDMALWHSSGGKSLCAAIATQAQTGRTADIDQAQALLAQFGAAVAPQPAAAGAAAAAPPPTTERRPTPQPGTVSAAATAATTVSRVAEIALDGAVQILAESGRELLREIDGDGAIDTDAVLVHCAETIGALSARLHENLAEDPDLLRAQDSAREGEEMLMLFQLERGEDAALDAVTLLLQLRKEFAIRESA